MDPVNPPTSLVEALEREDLTLDELTRFAESFLVAIAPQQTRYKVTERPDARTVRYYVSQGLLPRPVGHQGGRARYAGTHLLRLLFIKQQQARHQTLRRIGEELRSLSDEQILKLLRCDGQAGASDAAPDRQTDGVGDALDAEWVRRFQLGKASHFDAGSRDLESRAARHALAAALETLAARLRNEPPDANN